jgi:hypothetical protein
MEEPLMQTKAPSQKPTFTATASDRFDLDALLHPARAFAHPQDVASDADLTLSEKRAILSAWASDACAVEAAPALRRQPGGGNPVKFDDIMEVLRALDQQAQRGFQPQPHYRRVLARRVPGVFNRKSRDREPGGNRSSWN